MSITVYDLKGCVVDTPVVSGDEDMLIYENISGMSMRGVTFKKGIDKERGQLSLSDQDQSACLECAQKIEAFKKSGVLENFHAMKSAIGALRNRNITLEGFKMPKLPIPSQLPLFRGPGYIKDEVVTASGRRPFVPSSLESSERKQG